ncbi:MAG: hypothetical protein U0470_10450 [Anaerolineae bacterium]
MTIPRRAGRIATGLTVLLGAAGFAAGLFASPRRAVACRCLPPPPPAEALAVADAVVRGAVVALAADEQGISATLRVRTVWKGPTGRRLSIRSAADCAACGYPFHLGDDLIVYAHAASPGEPRVFQTTSCDRTSPYDAAEAEALGAPTVERPAGDPPTPNCPLCPIPSAAWALAGASVAFLGQPVRVQDAGPEGDWSRRVRFRVLGAWKGDPPAEVDVTAPFLAWACRGQHWLDDPAGALVFAQRAPGGALTVSICGRLERYDPADAASLGPMTPPAPPAKRVYLPLAARSAPVDAVRRSSAPAER